jgi:hypothetical protein
MKQHNDWVSASDIGQACYCPKALTHKYSGTSISVSAIAARKQGNQAHDELNKDVEDKRCFVASHLFGTCDPRTELLRRFRDTHLRSMPGRCLVELYYRTSPSLVVAARQSRPLDAVMRWAVTQVVRRLESTEARDKP